MIGLPGGLQPRHAVGYGFTVACEVAALLGVAAGMRTQIDTAAAHLEEDRDALVAQAGEIAEQLAGTVPLIYGCELTVPVAYRWKTQINENAKQHAFDHQLPELDHNEIVGWTRTAAAAALLRDLPRRLRPAPAPARARRADREADRARGAAVVAVETEGETRVQRLLCAVMLGDLVSLYLAAHNGVDPGPIEMIDQLKDELESS